MTDRAIKYTASVDTNPFAAGMARVTSVLQGVSQRFGATGRDWKSTGEAMSAQMTKITDSVRSEVSAMGGHFGSLVGALGNTKVGLMALVGAAAALAASKAVNATARMTESAMDLARVLGTSTNAAQVWRIALQDVGASQDELQGAAKGMARQLKENEAEMNALGLVTRDAAGNLRPMNALLVDGLQIMNDHAEGADRALAGQQLFGRGVDASSKLLLVNQQTLADATQTMTDLGLEVGGNAVSAWKEYDAATDRAGFSVQGLVKTIGSILMPVLTDLVRVFNAVMPAAIVVVRGALGGLATAFHAIKNGVVVVWEVINAMVVTVAEPLRAVAEAIGRAITGDFAGAAAAIKGIGGVISGAWSQAMDNMAESSRQARDRFTAIWTADTMPGEPEGQRGTRTVAPEEKKEEEAKEAEDPSFMQYYEAALTEEKRLAAEKDALREYSKQQEAEYWRNLLQNADLSSKDRVAIMRKVADLEIQILRDQAKQRQALDAELLNGQQARALAAVEAAELEARGRYELGETSNAQLLEQERLLEEQRTEIRRQYLQARLAMVDPDRDPVQYEQISQQIEELERQHRLRLRQIQLSEEAIIRAPLANVWQAAEQSMANAINGMINRTMTLRQAMTSIWAGIRGAIVGEIAKIIAAKVAAWAKERLLALAGIGANAAEAGAGAAKSVASIPFVGPVLAVAALAAVMAAVMSAKSSVPSARGGFDIPFGMNPLTQLHEREMVLPQEQADVVRDMARDRGEDRAPVVLRGVSAGDFFVANKHELIKALKSARRDFQV
jgi:hypothetical protein